MKKVIIFSILIVMTVLLCSCWDIREINELGLVTAVGVDKGEYSKYAITVQVANPSSESKGEVKTSAENNVWIGTAEGDSIFSAVRKLVTISSRRIMWAHNNVVIIGESLAKESIIPVIDFFTHNPELRMKAGVVVSKGDARNYITANAGMDSPSGISFVFLEHYRKLNAQSPDSSMLKLSSQLRNKYTNPLAAVVSMKKSTIKSQEDGSTKSSETVDMSGAAVFKKDKLVGWLTPDETRGISWILNESKNTVVTVFDKEHENNSVAIETKGMKSIIRSQIVNGLPHVFIEITGVGDIVEEDGSTRLGIYEMKERVAYLLNEKIKDEIQKGLKIVQKEYKVDVLGFAAIIHAQNNTLWEGLIENDWQEIFPRIPIALAVDINIETSTLNQEPMQLN